MTQETVDTILRMYAVPRTSISKVALDLGISQRNVRKVLGENNIHIRSLSELYSLNVDETFFDVIDTEEKAYWLGFIYADGYITKDIFGIKLSSEDYEHLLKLKEALKSEHKIGKYVGHNGYSNNSPYCSLTIKNKHLVHSLLSKGVKYRKS